MACHQACPPPSSAAVLLSTRRNVRSPVWLMQQLGQSRRMRRSPCDLPTPLNSPPPCCRTRRGGVIVVVFMPQRCVVSSPQEAAPRPSRQGEAGRRGSCEPPPRPHPHCAQPGQGQARLTPGGVENRHQVGALRALGTRFGVSCVACAAGGHPRRLVSHLIVYSFPAAAQRVAHTRAVVVVCVCVCVASVRSLFSQSREAQTVIPV